MSCASRSSCSPIRAIPTGRSPPSCSVMSPPSPSGADGLPSPDALVCSTNHAPADRHATHPCNKHKSSPCFANPKRPPPRQTPPPAPFLFQPRTWSRPPQPLKRPPLLQARKWLRHSGQRGDPIRTGDGSGRVFARPRSCRPCFRHANRRGRSRPGGRRPGWPCPAQRGVCRGASRSAGAEHCLCGRSSLSWRDGSWHRGAGAASNVQPRRRPGWPRRAWGNRPRRDQAASPSQEEKPQAAQQEPSQSSARQQANFGPQDRPASSHDTFWKSQTLPEALPGAPAFRPHAEHSRLRLYPLGTTEADEPSRYGHRARHGNDTDKRRPRPSHAARSSCSRRQGR